MENKLWQIDSLVAFFLIFSKWVIALTVVVVVAAVVKTSMCPFMFPFVSHYPTWSSQNVTRSWPYYMIHPQVFLCLALGCLETKYNHGPPMVSKTRSRFMFSFRGRICTHQVYVWQSLSHHRVSLQSYRERLVFIWLPEMINTFVIIMWSDNSSYSLTVAVPPYPVF